jgi:NADH-quinone oxidoreductase subunit N
MSWEAINSTMPMTWPSLAAMGILVLGGKKRSGPAPLPPLLALGGLALALVWIFGLWGEEVPRELFDGAVRVDTFSLFLGLVAVFCGASTVLLSKDYLKRYERNHAEYYALILFAVTGMIMMVSSRNFITLLFGLEIMSVSFYVLCGFFRDQTKSVEASIKYFLTGSFATGLFLFGMALVYGGTGSLDLADMGRAMTGAHVPATVLLGTGFLVAGFAFKIAAVPFHQWLPDVYEGAPTTVTGFMATGVKVAAFGALIRVFSEVYRQPNVSLRDLLWWLAVMTMTVGNVAALAQQSVKRMLAYSSIAHAGYLLVGIVVMTGIGEAGAAFGSAGAVAGILFYVFAYALTNIGAFGVLGYFERQERGGVRFDDLAGLRQRFPLPAFALTVFMFSLAGIPGTAGFLGKFLVFGAALDAGERVSDDSFVVLAILGILNSLVGLYYYLRVPIQLYVKPLPDERFQAPALPAGKAFTFIVLVCVAATIWYGFGPSIFGVGVESALTMVGSALRSLR